MSEAFLGLLIWPAAFVLFAVIALLIFRTPIAAKIRAMKSLAAGNKSIDFESDKAAEQRQENAAPAALTESSVRPEDAMPPPPEPFIAPVEDAIRSSLSDSKGSAEVKQAWLVRAVAEVRIARAHEMTYRIITGSQIELLLRANTPAQIDVETAREVYNQAVAAFPLVYKDFSFDTWLNYPVNINLLSIEPAGAKFSLLRITPLGRNFLHYLVNNGLTGQKPG